MNESAKNWGCSHGYSLATKRMKTLWSRGNIWNMWVKCEVKVRGIMRK